MPIAAIQVGERLRDLDHDHVERIRKSFTVTTVQLTPITVTTDGRLIDGWHRIEAAKAMGWHEIYAMRIAEAPQDLRLLEATANITISPSMKRLHEIAGALSPRVREVGPRPRWNPELLSCKGCGKNFVPKSPQQRFCATQCRVSTHRAKQADKRAQAALEALQNICITCGESLAKRTLRARYCSTTCRTRAWKQAHQENA